MLKGLVVDIAMEVGNSASLLLNQIYQWFKTQNVKKVYRTNQELADDLQGLLSTATIQRAKRKLEEKGYVIISFDKGLNRTTHFTLTEKALSLLNTKKLDKKESPVAKSNNTSDQQKEKPKGKPAFYQKKDVNQGEASTSAMKESFEEGFSNSKAIPAPKGLLQQLISKAKGEKVVTQQEVVKEPVVDVSVAPMTTIVDDVIYEDDSHLFPKKESWIDNEDDVSDEEYFKAIDLSIASVFKKPENVEQRNMNMQNLMTAMNYQECY